MRCMKVVVMALVILAAVASHPYAQEFTGDRIKLLVDQIDSSITSFEKQTAGYGENKNRLQQEADDIYERLTKANDQLQKESLLADLLYNQALQHRQDWTYVQATKGALFELVPRLSRLAGEVEKASRMGFTSSQEYQQYRIRMETFLSNSSQILKGVVRSVDDPALKKNIRDAALALQSAQFSLSVSGRTGTASIAEVQETVRLLENSIAQLQNIESSLLAEKFTLQLEGYRSMVRLVINQLNLDGPLATDKLPSFVEACVGQIRQRNGRLSSAVGYVEGADPAFTNPNYLTDDEIEAMLDDVSPRR